MSMKEHVMFAYNTIKYTFSNSRITPYGGLLIPGQMLKAVDFDTKIDKYSSPSKEYKNSDVLKAMLIGILCGNADFESIHETDDDPEFFCNAFHMRHIPSEPTMRQRMDEIGASMQGALRQINVDLFKKFGVEPSALENGYIPIDIDVSPFLDEKCNKEGISRTYKKKDGYAPIFAYIGTEGYLIACELREGKQHCQKGTPKEYIGQTFRDVSYNVPDASSKSGHSRKTVGIRTIYDITERACDHDGQYYISPKIDCDMYSVNVDFSDEDIIELYHKHGEMEQYHSEIKTDLCAEQFPSGKFETNELVLELIQLAYNLLRMIGQASLRISDIPMKRPVNRRRLRTVVERIIMTPGVVTKHARQVRLDLGRSNPWRNAASQISRIFQAAK